MLARTHARADSVVRSHTRARIRTDTRGQVVPVVCDSNGNIDVNDVRIKAEMYKDTLSCAMITSAPGDPAPPKAAAVDSRLTAILRSRSAHAAVTQRSRSGHAAVTQRR
jgi:hypothetical protein